MKRHSHRNAPVRSAGIALAAVLLLSGITGGKAQSFRSAESLPIDAPKRAAVIDSVSAALIDTYIFLDVAEEMEKHLRNRMKDGAYDDVATISEFAQVLTQDLQEISHDRHLRVVYMPPEVVAELTAESDSSDADADRERERRMELARRNFDFRRAEVLPGNVGYLRFDSFVGAEYAGPTAIAALNFLAHCDALIIDLRQNGGGNPSLIQLITSYFLEEPTHLNSFYIRKSDETQQFWTQAHVEGPRMTETDIYVLASSYTFSGAEEFTYNMKNLERGTIVGETTGGGAHPVQRVLFDDLYVGMNLPYGRAVNPISGTNWEGTGVAPDVDVPADQALETAHIMALEKIKEGETDEERLFAVDWAIQGLKAQLEPTSVDPARLQTYAGEYGPRTLTFTDGQLIYQREGRPAFRAIPMSETLFRFEELEFFRLEVVVDDSGQPVKLVGHYDNGSVDESPRVSSP
jgi:hypothetical protein